MLVDPNQIKGTIRWNNPAGPVLNFLTTGGFNTMADNPNVKSSLTAREVSNGPHQASTTFFPLGRVSTIYEDFSVSTVPITGIQYDVSPRMVNVGGTIYHFATKTSDPCLPETAPDVTLDFEECAGLIRIHYRSAANILTPVPVDSSGVYAYIPANNNELQAYGGPVQNTMAIDHTLIVRGGNTFDLTVSADTHVGTSWSLDYITFHTISNYTITVPCNEIVDVTLLIPDFTGPTNGALGRIIGKVDMRTELEHWLGGSFTVMTAYNGPQANFRYGDVGLQVQPAQNAPCPGISPFVGQPGCNSAGQYVLGNLLPSDFMPDLNDPPGSRPYRVHAVLTYGLGRRFQTFDSPHLGVGSHNPPVPVAGSTVDLGDTFVFNPGWVEGDVYLCAPDEPGQTNSPLRHLHWSSDDDDNLDGIPNDFTFGYTSQVVASGRDEFGASATRTASGATARTLFDGSFMDSGPDKDHFVGNYRLTLGGLKGEATRWNQSQIWLNFLNLGAANHLSSQIQIYNTSFENVHIIPGQTIRNNHRYGMSRVTVRFHTTSGLLSQPRIIGTGSFNGTDFEGHPANYGVNIHYADGTPGWQDTPQPDGAIVMCLPEGAYTFEPTVELVNGNSSTHNILPSFTRYISPCSSYDSTDCLFIALTNLFDCRTNRNVPVAGSVSSCTNVTNISYVLNGVTTTVCNNCGVNPSFGFNIVLADCENQLTVIARDVNGQSASVSRSIHYDVTPPVLSGCTNLSTNSLAGTNGNFVSYNVTALDDCDGVVPVTCEPPSGSFFQNGTTTVTCSARDHCNTNSCSFTIEVRSDGCLELSNTGVTCVSNAPGSYRYSFTARNLTPGPVKYLFIVPEPDCFTTSPSFFTFSPPLLPGQSASRDLILQDIQPSCGDRLCMILSLHDSNFNFCCAITNCIPNPALPRVDCPSNIAVRCTSPFGALVNYPAPTASSLCCTPVFVTCLPPPGLFPIGLTTVICTAVDACFKTNSCQFTVTVTCPTNCCENCTTNDYVRFTNSVPSGYSYLANPLCHGTNNNLLTLLAAVPDGTMVLIWYEATQVFDTYTYDTVFGGWVDEALSPADSVNLDPGKGFMLFNPDAAYSIVWTGCIPDCPPPCLPKTNCVLVGGYGVNPARWTSLSSCPPVCGTQVKIWNGTTFAIFTYDNGWTPSEPVLPAGHSAWVCITNCPCPCLLGTNAPVPPNDDCANALSLPLGVTQGYTFNATPSPVGSIVPCFGTQNSPDVWYMFTAPCPGGTLCVDTCLDPCPDAAGGPIPHFNTVLSAYTGVCPLLTQLACNDNTTYCGTNGPATSSRLCIKVKPLVPYLIRVSGKSGATGCFALNATFTPDPLTPPKNDSCNKAIEILCNQNKAFNTCNATTAGPADCPITKDVWYKLTPGCTGEVAIATCRSFFDTAMAVYTGSCNNLMLVACNDNANDGPCTGSAQSRVTFNVTVPGTTYFIRVGGANGASGQGNLTVIGPNPAEGTCPPTNSCAGVPKKRVFRLAGTSTHTPWSWCLSSPCCFNISGTVNNPPPAGAPASALVAALVDSINAACPGRVTAHQVGYSASNPATNRFWIAVNECDTCCLPNTPQRLPFVLRVGAVGTPCDDMCVVVPATRAIPVPTTAPCSFNPFMTEEPLSELDCNNNGEDDTIDILTGASQDVDENGIPDGCPIGLSIAYNFDGDETEISWAAANAILEYSTTMAGPWIGLPDAVSPYVLPVTGSQKFFRLRLP